MLLSILAASELGNTLADKIKIPERVVTKIGEGVIRVGEGTISAGQDF